MPGRYMSKSRYDSSLTMLHGGHVMALMLLNSFHKMWATQEVIASLGLFILPQFVFGRHEWRWDDDCVDLKVMSYHLAY